MVLTMDLSLYVLLEVCLDVKADFAFQNMSLGGGKSPSLDLAVNRAVKAGLHFAVAAGNDNRDACSYSPAAAENAITVGASTIGDQRAYFSNFGKCVDIFAPGLNILSTWNTGPRSTNRISGTSMGKPHLCGIANQTDSFINCSFSAHRRSYCLLPLSVRLRCIRSLQGRLRSCRCLHAWFR